MCKELCRVLRVFDIAHNVMHASRRIGFNHHHLIILFMQLRIIQAFVKSNIFGKVCFFNMHCVVFSKQPKSPFNFKVMGNIMTTLMHMQYRLRKGTSTGILLALYMKFVYRAHHKGCMKIYNRGGVPDSHYSIYNFATPR